MSTISQLGKYQPYPEYKDSGVEWVGDVPVSWQVKRLGQYLFERREKCSDKEFMPLSVTKGGIVPQLDTAAKTDAGDNRKRVKKGDFVINSRSDRKGSSGISSLDGSVSLISIVLEPKLITAQYVHHLLRSYPFQEEFYRFGKGIVADLWSTNYSEMKNINIPVPSEEEQRIIATFLDYETTRIDKLIAKQQQLIELLKEKRQAVISHAVTKGLNPNAPMKDSGVEWLGEVPEHWVVRRLKHHIVSMDQGWSPQCEARLSEDGEFGVMKVGCVNGGIFKAHEHKALPAELEPKTEYRLKKGQLLVSRANSRELVGSAAVVDADYENLLLCDKLYRIKLSSDVSPEFVALLLGTLAYRGQIELSASGASDSMQNIGQSTVKELPITIPPLTEVNNILTYIATRLSTFDYLNNQLHQQNLLLQERRTALISAAVTGKIDLRGWQAPDGEAVA